MLSPVGLVVFPIRDFFTNWIWMLSPVGLVVFPVRDFFTNWIWMLSPVGLLTLGPRLPTEEPPVRGFGLERADVVGWHVGNHLASLWAGV